MRMQETNLKDLKIAKVNNINEASFHFHGETGSTII